MNISKAGGGWSLPDVTDRWMVVDWWVVNRFEPTLELLELKPLMDEPISPECRPKNDASIKTLPMSNLMNKRQH